MAYTLIDVMSTIEDDKRLATIMRVLDTSPMLNLFETVLNPSGSSTIYVEGELPDVGYVDYGAVAADSSGSPDEPITTHLKKMQARIPIDYVLAEREVRMGGNFKAKEVRKHVRAMALNWKRFIMGRGTAGDAVTNAKDPKGLYGWVDEWKGEEPRIDVDFGGVTVQAKGLKGTMDQLAKLIDAVYSPDFILGSRNVINDIKNLVETAGITEKMANKVGFTMFDFNGSTAKMRVMTYEDIPLIPVDEDSQKTPIMAADEDGINASSLIAVRTNPDDGVVLNREFPDMFKIREYTLNGQDVVEITGPNNIEARHPRSVARLRKIVPST